MGLTHDPLVLLLKVTQVDNKPFPIGIFTAWAVVQYITDITGAVPVDVEVLTDQEIIVQMEPAEMVVTVAQEFQNMCKWVCHQNYMCSIHMKT